MARSCHDNLVSWTSSLLLALRYGHYRQQTESGLRLDEIKLCIVRTGGLRAGTFLRDAYLLDFYSKCDLPVPGAKDSQSLVDMKSMRNKGWYFGEYLSQDSLKTTERCSIVSVRQLIDFWKILIIFINVYANLTILLYLGQIIYKTTLQFRKNLFYILSPRIIINTKLYFT